MPKDAINWHVSTRKQNNKPMKTWAKDGNRDFCQEDRKRDNGCMNTCSPSLSLRPMQMQTARAQRLTVVRMAIRKQTGSNKCQRGGGEKGSLLHHWWERSEEHTSELQSRQ